MANITIRVPDELREKMGRFDYVNWSALFRSFVEEKLQDFEVAESIAAKSRLTQKDLDGLKPLVDADFRQEGRRLLREIDRGR